MRRSDHRRRVQSGSLVVALGLAVVALVLIIQPVVTARTTPGRAASGQWEYQWSAPVNLGPVINTAGNENMAALSKGGTTLYFVRGGQIWVSQREDRDMPWEPPVQVAAVGPGAAPALSRDGHWLFFESVAAGGFGSTDLWASWRQYTHDDFGWETPVNLGPAVNWQYEDQGPCYLERDDGAPPELYYSTNRRMGAGYMDINVSRLGEDGTFGPPEEVVELNSPNNDMRPQLTRDGREIFFHSNRPGGLGISDIWFSTRPTLSSPWEPPIPLTAVNSTVNDAQPAISGDGNTLIFMSTRPGGYGGQDLWMSTRTRVKVER